MDTMENTVETEVVESEVVTQAPAVIPDDDRNELVEADDNGSVALGVMAGMLLAGGVYVAYTKAIKPGIKWCAKKVKKFVDKAAADDPKEEAKPEEAANEEAPKTQEESKSEESEETKE